MRFEVVLCTSMTQTYTATVEVEAADEDEAAEMAVQMANEGKGVTWYELSTLNDGEIEVDSVEEIK